MKCKLIREMTYGPDAGPDKVGTVAPAGTVVDHRQAWLLVKQGVAVPEDEECKQKVGVTPEQMTRAQHAYDRISHGVHPEDFQAYDEGLMIGYNPDGSWKPGPNWEDWDWERQKQASSLIIED